MIYKPRLSAPEITNKYYKHVSANGVNECILIKNGSCLPNCVGYSWGRWYEILEVKPKLSRRNAEEWYLYKEDGYKRGSTPKLGAVICWRKGVAGNSADGAGHCAIVEKINDNGDITISMSDYYGTYFTTKTLSKPYNYASMVLQGFIYLPVEFTNNANNSDIEVIAKEVIQGRWGNGTERKERLERAGYNYNEIQRRVNELINGEKKTYSYNIDTIAKEVYQGKWGNGTERKERLEKAGYNYNEVQKRVNELFY